MLLGDDSTVLICTGVVVTDDFAGVVIVTGMSLGADIAVKSIGLSLVPSPIGNMAFDGVVFGNAAFDRGVIVVNATLFGSASVEALAVGLLLFAPPGGSTLFTRLILT